MDCEIATKASNDFTRPCHPSAALRLSPVSSHGGTRRPLSRRQLFQQTGWLGTAPCIADVSPETATDDAGCLCPSVTVPTDIDDTCNNQLIGDFSRPCCLPVVHSKHTDLHSISPETVIYHFFFRDYLILSTVADTSVIFDIHLNVN